MSKPSLTDTVLSQFYAKKRDGHLQPKIKRNADEFTRMWLEGETYGAIKKQFSITEAQIKIWRETLGLPRRLPGGHMREVQVAHMQKQIQETKEVGMRPIREIFRSHAVFDAEGRHINGTDKQSNHNYGDTYEMIFHGLRMPTKLVMEVGVADGSSLLAWREVFPNAQIVGLDIHPASRVGEARDRIEFHLGSQTSKQDCERAADHRQFDVIVEDATHVLENTLTTFLFLWPFVKPGGMYIVEEWDGIGDLRANIGAMWPQAKVFDTVGPFGGNEPLVVFRKPS